MSTTVDGLPRGLVAAIETDELTVTAAAGMPPKDTVDPGTKFDPLTATTVPPPFAPALGLIEATVGGASYVNWSAGLAADVPPNGTVTVTSIVLAGAAGDVAVIDDDEFTMTFVA